MPCATRRHATHRLPSLSKVPSEGTAPAFSASPNGAEAKPDPERADLLARIADAQVASRTLVLLILKAEGPAALSTEALRRASRILDAIEPAQNGLG